MRRFATVIIGIILAVGLATGCSKKDLEAFQQNDPYPPYNLLKLFDGFPSLKDGVDSLSTQKINYGLGRMLDLGIDMPEFLSIAVELIQAPFLTEMIGELDELLGVLRDDGAVHYDDPSDDDGGFYDGSPLSMAERQEGFYAALDTVMNNTELGSDVLAIAAQVVNHMATEKTPAEIEDTMASMTGVRVYQHCMYDTAGYAVDLRAGEYNLPYTDPITSVTILDNDISSLEVPIGMKITLYSDGGFAGNSIELTGSDRCLTNETIGASPTGSWNDYASSVRVEYDLTSLAKLLGKVTMSCDYPMWVNGSHEFCANRDDANAGTYTNNTDLGNAVEGVVGLLYGLNSIASGDPEARDIINNIILTDLPALFSAVDAATMRSTSQIMADLFAPDEITDNTYDTSTDFNRSNPANGYIDASLHEAIRDMFPTLVKLFIRDDDSAVTDDTYRIFEDATNRRSPIEALCVTLDKLRQAGIDYSQPGNELEPSLKRMVEYNAYGQVRTNPNFRISHLDHMVYTIGGGYYFGYLTRPSSSSGEPQWGGSDPNFDHGHGTPTKGVITINDSMYSMTSNAISIPALYGATSITMSSYDLALDARGTQGGRVWRRANSSFAYNDASKSEYQFYLGYDFPTMLLLPTAAAGDAGIPNGGQTVATGYADTTSGENYKTYWPKVEDGTGTLNTGAFLFSWIARACWDGQGPYYATSGSSTTVFDMPDNGPQNVEVYYKPNGEVYAYVYKGSDPWEYYYPSSAITGVGDDVADPDDSCTPKQRANRYRDVLKSDYYMVQNGTASNQFCVPSMNPDGWVNSYAEAQTGANKFRLTAGTHSASYFQIYERVQEWTNADVVVDADETILGNESRECDTHEEAMYRNYQWLMLEKKFMFTIPMWIRYDGILGCGAINSAAFVIIEGNGVLGLANAKKGGSGNGENGYWVIKNSEGVGTNPTGHCNDPDYGDSLLPGDARILVLCKHAVAEALGLTLLDLTPEVLFKGVYQNLSGVLNAAGFLDYTAGPVLGSGYVLPEAVGKNIAPVVRLGFVDQPDLIPSDFDASGAAYANRNKMLPIFVALAGTLRDGTKYIEAGSGYDYNYAGAHKYPLMDLLEGLMIPLARPMYRYFSTNGWGWVPRIEYETPGNFSYFLPSVKNGSMDYRPRDELRTALNVLSGISSNTNDGLLPKLFGSSGTMVTRLLSLLQKIGSDTYASEREEISRGLEQVMTSMRIDKSRTINNGYTWLSHPAWMFARDSQSDPVVTRDEDIYVEDLLGSEGPYRVVDDWSDFNEGYAFMASLMGGSRDITPNLVNIMNAVLAQPLTEDQVHGLLYTVGKLFAQHKQDYSHPYPAPDVDEAWNYHGDIEGNDALLAILSTLPEVHDILADGSGGRYGLMMANMDQLLSDHDSLLYYVMENMTTSYGSEQIFEDLQDFLQWPIVSEADSPLWRDLALMLDGMAGMVGKQWDMNVLFDYYGFQRN